MPGIKTVIFDIDNTLYDFVGCNQLGLEALRAYTREQFGWSRDEFDRRHKSIQTELCVSTGYNGCCRNRMLRYQKLLEQAGLPLHPHALQMYELYWMTLLENMQPFEGAVRTIKTLKEAGIRIGIGTDMTVVMQLRKLEKLQLLAYVDFIVTSEEAGKEKPSPELFSLVLEKALCCPEECLFVGDHLEKDVHGALSAGMRALWYHPEKENFRPIDPSAYTGSDTSDAERRISKLTQVLEEL